MAEAVSRELILPAVRLDVPPRPSKQQVSALAERSADAWTTSPQDWAAQVVVRLAVARLLQARLEPGPGRAQEHSTVPADPEQATLAQLAGLFRPHVGLAAQAFELAVVEAVNAGVPAAVDPVREGLRRVGVTGRDPLRMVALGLDKLPTRARSAFWDGVRGSSTLTAVVDALAARGGERPHDVSGLDRSELARADALVLAGGRITPVAFSTPAGGRAQEGRATWITVPLAVVRQRHQGRPDAADGRRGGGAGGGTAQVEVALRGDAWVDVFETALDAVGSAMQQIDGAGRPRGRTTPLAEAVSTRLVAARERTVADVCASLRDVDPFALELFDHQVTTSSVPVAVPAVEDDLFVQLWLPTSALAGPLFTGAPDLFLGGAADVRQQGGRPAAKGAPGGQGDRQQGQGQGQGRQRGKGGERPQGRPQERTGTPGEPGTGGGGRSRRGRRGRSGTPEGTPDHGPEQTPDQTPDQTPAPASDGAPGSTPEQAPATTPEAQSPAPAGLPAPSGADDSPGSIQ